jgi:hypothetical protein
MNSPNRDLLVMFKQELMSPQAIEQQVSMLHHMLFHVERLDNVARAHEVIDLNKYKIFEKEHEIRNFFRQRKEKPFVFLNNKN